MLLLLVLTLLPCLTVAQTANKTTAVYSDSKTYSYYGCYNETTEIDGSDHSRALSGGANSVKQGEMTVPMCLDFCYKAGENGTHYRYAGLEWARECWCSESIAGIAKKLDDGECNFPCEGNSTLACGGSLKLSVYKLSSASLALSVPVSLLVLGSVTATFLTL